MVRMQTWFRASPWFRVTGRATTVALLVAGVVLAPVVSVSAQSFPERDSPNAAPGTARANGSTLLRSSIFGAVTGTVLAFGYYFVSEKGERSSGCQPLNCALPFLSSTGAIAGLFIGRELDAQRRAFAPRVGEKIEFGFAEAAVLAPPTYIDVGDSLIAVVSDSGAQLFSATPSPKALRRRAAGLSAMRQVVLVPSRNSIVLGTGTALWESPLVSGPASRMSEGPIDALAASRDAVLSASGPLVRLRTGEGDAALQDSLTLSMPVTAMAYDSIGRSWWVATDSQLVQLTHANGKLTQTTVRLALPASARAIATSSEWIAAALGDEGIIAWRRDQITSAVIAPVRLQNEPRFAYDLAFLGGGLFVAGGVDGLFQVALSPTPMVVGSSRQLQFATTVRAGNGVLWVGDRNRQSIVRVTP